VYHRADCGGILISAMNYTSAAIEVCREALLKGRVVILCTLEEIVYQLENSDDIANLLRKKIQSAIIDKAITF
ncbi:MAG TPA: restriction endonuclease, partial [Dehalococcoidia bacterium]